MYEKRDRCRCGNGRKDTGRKHVTADVTAEKGAALEEDLSSNRHDGIDEECEGVKQEKQEMKHDFFPREGSGSFSSLAFFVGMLGCFYLVGKYTAAFNHSCIIASHNKLRSVAVGDISKSIRSTSGVSDLFRPRKRIFFLCDISIHPLAVIVKRFLKNILPKSINFQKSLYKFNIGW